MKKSIFSILVFSFFMVFLMPIAKVGWCPAGYKANGNYCVPGKNAKPAIIKNGWCPAGYKADGNYCMATGSAKPAMPKTNAFCPSGYKADGNYCVQR